MNNLKKIRTAKRITQKQLASMLGVTDLTVHKWESGVHQIKDSKLKELARIFSCDVAEILGLNEIGKQTVNIIGNLPMPSPLPDNRNFSLLPPLEIITINPNVYGFVQQSQDMNRRCLPGQIVLVSLTEITPQEAHGKYVIAEVEKKIIFRKFELPNRFLPESTDSGFDVLAPEKFKLLGVVFGIQHVLG